jgi:hypothetical protein
MLRRLLAVIAGLLAGMLVILAAESLSGLLHPLPPPAAAGDERALQAYVARLPSTAFVLVLCGHALGSIAAGAVATLVARRAVIWPALSAGFGLFLAGAVNVIALPHPTWFVGLDLACYLPLAWLGARLVASSQPASGAGSTGA